MNTDFYWKLTKEGWKKALRTFDLKAKVPVKKKVSVKKRNRKLVRERYEKSGEFIEIRKKSEMSSSEKKIAEFLKNNGVRFIREYYTTYCYNWKTQHLLFFDFFLPDQNAAIEFDGPHHYKPVYGDDRLVQQRYKDGRKNKYCFKNKIRLLRIPYWKGNDIENIICKWFDEYF